MASANKIEEVNLVSNKLQRWDETVDKFDMSQIKVPEIKVITKLPNSEQSYKGKVKTHNYINKQNQSTTGKL